MITGDHEKLKDLAGTQLCAEHKTPVVVAWYSSEKCWTLRCGEGHYPDSLIRIPTLTEEYKQGTLPDGPIADNVKEGARRRAMQQGKQSTAMTFSGVPATDLGTGELLTLEVVKALVDYARKYQLDPARGHVVLMYSKPYITIDGYLYHANQSKVAYSLTSRPLEEDELKGYRAPENAHVWISTVRFTESGKEFVGYGVVTQEEMTAKSPRDQSKLRSPVVAAHPWQLAQKRAEWQALRRAFPIGETEER